MPSNTLLESDSRWDVQEGAASEIMPALKNKRSEVLAFVVEGEADEVVRQKFAVLKQLANMVNTVMEDRSAQKWSALVEALTPDVQFSPNKIVEAEMMGRAKKAVLESEDFVTASAIAEAAHFSSKNPSSQPNRWKRSGQIFAIPYKGTDLYPLYALNPKEGMRPLPVVADVLKFFPDKDSWQIAFWFGSVNSYLKSKMPKDLLKSNPKDVLRAAEMEAVGVQHG